MSRGAICTLSTCRTVRTRGPTAIRAHKLAFHFITRTKTGFFQFAHLMLAAMLAQSVGQDLSILQGESRTARRTELCSRRNDAAD